MWEARKHETKTLLRTMQEHVRGTRIASETSFTFLRASNGSKKALCAKSVFTEVLRIPFVGFPDKAGNYHHNSAHEVRMHQTCAGVAVASLRSSNARKKALCSKKFLADALRIPYVGFSDKGWELLSQQRARSAGAPNLIRVIPDTAPDAAENRDRKSGGARSFCYF